MRTRLLLVFVGVMALVLLVHDVPLATHLQRVEHDRLVTQLERDAFVIAGRAEEGLEDGTIADQSALQALIARYAVEEDVHVVIVDADGLGVASSEPSDVGEVFSNRPEIEEALTGVPTSDVRFSETLGEDLFYVAVPVLSGQNVHGAVRLSALDSVVDQRTTDRVQGLLLVALISLAIAAAVAWLFAVSVTRPIRRLQAATQEISNGDLTVRAVDDDGPPEVRDLAVSFNAMASRLQNLVERQRSFAGTASHQLRTPLTALRLRLDQLASGGDLSDESERHVDAALAETDRLRRMIEGLLALSRAEGDVALSVTADLADVVRQRAEHWEPLAAEQQVTLVADTPEQLLVVTMDGALEQIIDNLVDNALEVSPPGSTLTLRTVLAGDHSELHVIDAGPGLSELERQRAFDRFWRGEGAPHGGSGLGLAIVRQLAVAGGGDADLRAAAGGGLDAVVRFRNV